ncbi:hypothetical protein [Calycomorphotria hydatis]|uniref:Translocation protein TolB n=1 Tax=Calycomorphotria hydatis TaxID=2528027 RepID=A0A517T911_9PLAN|nr:hypothetical protein [Calycomorphotria hydatis]QDT64856.1 hypothetical protein V22_20990 [Calycomorphotria hydatis]
MTLNSLLRHPRFLFLQTLLWASVLLVPATVPAAEQPDLPVQAITSGPKFHWRGYYDKFLTDPSDRYVLVNQVNFEGRSPTAGDYLQVGMVDLQNDNEWIELGSTTAWSWQQGCMLQWVPQCETDVIWNDRENGKYVSQIHNIKTGETRTLPRPIYCLSPDGKTAFFTDFRRLNETRPGYGYAGIDDPNRDVLAPEDIGIWKMDLKTGEYSLIFSMKDAAEILYDGREEKAFTPESKHWFNHLLCSPDGKRLFFLHRWNTPPKRGFDTRAFTMNVDGTAPYVLDPHGGTSHFVWRDPNHIFAWAWHPSHKDSFYLYEDKTDNVKQIGGIAMPKNGHNTYIPGTNNEWVLNDTYPNRDRMQVPYIYHIPTDRRINLGEFYSPLSYKGEWRCDNHPCTTRDGTKVIFDSPHGGGRQVYMIDIGELIKD